MNQLVALPSTTLPAIVAAESRQAQPRFLEFFVSHIRNTNTRQTYGGAVGEFLAWCDDAGVLSLAGVQPLHVATWIEGQTETLAAPTAKQSLAAVRMLFDWLVVGQVVPVNPAASVRGPSHQVKPCKTPVLDPKEARALIDAIDVTTAIGLRDRALIGLMAFSFARVGAAIGMKVEDVHVQNRRLWVRLHEKGGKVHEMPCHHSLEEYLHAYIDGTGISGDAKGWLFRTIGRGTDRLTTPPLPQANAYSMVRRRALAAGIATKIGNHTFRATGITAYLKNGGTLEKAAAMANHSSTRTTQLYDRRSDEVTLDEVERASAEAMLACQNGGKEDGVMDLAMGHHGIWRTTVLHRCLGLRGQPARLQHRRSSILGVRGHRFRQTGDDLYQSRAS